MRCQKIKRLIIDYVDGELNERLRRKINSHLKDCPSCRYIEQTLRSSIIEHFKESEMLKPPDIIWDKIKNNIAKEKEGKSLYRLINYWLECIKIGIKRPLLFPAITTATIVILVIILFLGRVSMTRNRLNSYIEYQMQFILRLSEDEKDSYFGIGETDFGTSIEEFLL